MIIKFTADQVASVGLSHRAAQVEYDSAKRLSNYSCWLSKITNEQHEAALDKLIEMADAIVYH